MTAVINDKELKHRENIEEVKRGLANVLKKFSGAAVKIHFDSTESQTA